MNRWMIALSLMDCLKQVCSQVLEARERCPLGIDKFYAEDFRVTGNVQTVRVIGRMSSSPLAYIQSGGYYVV